MQYILTKEELNNLVPKKLYVQALQKIEKLNSQILSITDFKCIYDEPQIMVYCDTCPIVETCNKNKSFPK